MPLQIFTRLLPGIALLSLGYHASAQQSLRPSLSNPANNQRIEYAATGYDYNLKLGPAFLSLGTALGLEYNDNINLASKSSGGVGPLADFIYRPGVNIHIIWPTTKLNVLTLDLGLGLERHLNHPEYDQTNVTISPNTQLGYDVYIGNVRLNFHDQISVQNNPVTRSDTSNTGPYSQFNNTIGVSALWDLNKTILQASYDYAITRYTGDPQYERQNSGSSIFNFAASFPYSAALSGGLQGNFILTTYEDTTQPDITTASFGPFLQIKPTRYTSIQASAGYQKSHFQSQGDASTLGTESTGEGGGFLYYALDLQNQFNRHWSHSLTISRERNLGLTSALNETQTVRYNLLWQVNSRVSINSFAQYQRGQQGFSDSTESYNFYSFGFSCGYQLTRHLSAGFHYTRTQRVSDLSSSEYSQNTVGLDFSYAF